MGISIALQMYTLCNEAEKDLIGTLAKVAGMGYEGVEFAGFCGLSADKLRAALDGFGLKAAGSHTGKKELVERFDEVVGYNKEIGNKYVICPMENFTSESEVMATAGLFNEIGAKLKEEGLQFGYHNHAHEFAEFNGRHILDILYSNTDPDLVKAEIDTYWVAYAGEDPVEYIKRYSGRCPLIHMKDMGPDREMTEVGEGIIDMKSIIKTAKASGAAWLIVEQDVCRRSPLESVKVSFENLGKMVRGKV
jgi:sugar phosphate isomerase/epimerase